MESAFLALIEDPIKRQIIIDKVSPELLLGVTQYLEDNKNESFRERLFQFTRFYGNGDSYAKKAIRKLAMLFPAECEDVAKHPSNTLESLYDVILLRLLLPEWREGKKAEIIIFDGSLDFSYHAIKQPQETSLQFEVRTLELKQEVRKISTDINLLAREAWLDIGKDAPINSDIPTFLMENLLEQYLKNEWKLLKGQPGGIFTVKNLKEAMCKHKYLRGLKLPGNSNGDVYYLRLNNESVEDFLSRSDREWSAAKQKWKENTKKFFMEEELAKNDEYMELVAKELVAKRSLEVSQSWLQAMANAMSTLPPPGAQPNQLRGDEYLSDIEARRRIAESEKILAEVSPKIKIIRAQVEKKVLKGLDELLSNDAAMEL